MPNWKKLKGLSTDVFTSGQTPCIFPKHTLPNLDQIYAISEVTSLNNDQYKKKQYQQTTGLIQRLINISHFLSLGVIVAEKFCFKVCLAWKTISCQTDKGNRVKHGQI